MEYQTIILEKKDNIATVTLNRPEKLNAVNPRMYDELEDVLGLVDQDNEIRVVVLTGAGRAFCAGADVRETLLQARIEKKEKEGAGIEVIHRGRRLTWASIRKPVIASINGYAVGLGLTMTLACDIRIASEAARFSIRFPQLGRALDYNASYYLPRLIGIGQACELTLTAKTIDAQEAERIGLVNRVVPADELAKTTYEMASTIAKLPSLAIIVSKKALYQGMYEDPASIMQFEAFANNYLIGTEDTKEATKAFLEKREPVFKGR
ncbi:enoyl-CoA hydratase/isomerase family protein [Chloroflexota bacterium]